MIKKEEHERLLRNIESEIRSLRDLQISDAQDLTQMVWKNTLEYRKQSKNYNVYLFIEKIDEESCNFPIVRNIIAPFTNYGLFHVGLEIDGIIIEWGYGSAGSSIVCPRVDVERMLTYVRVNYEQINSASSPLSFILSGAVFAIASTVVALTGGVGVFFALLGVNAFAVILIASYSIIYHLGTIKKDRLKQIAEKCVHYNKTHRYNIITNNCQDFVNEILKSIGLKFKPEGEFKEFMDRIKRNDDSFRFKDNVFNSRADLDDYANDHWNNLENKWDKKLLICYSDVMERMYQKGKDEWGPMDVEKWQQRCEEFF